MVPSTGAIRIAVDKCTLASQAISVVALGHHAEPSQESLRIHHSSLGLVCARFMDVRCLLRFTRHIEHNNLEHVGLARHFAPLSRRIPSLCFKTPLVWFARLSIS